MYHVVIGSGPLGLETARSLRDHGLETRIVSRRVPAHLDGIEHRSADVTRPAEALWAVEGASVVYNCASAPYHRWPTDLPPVWRGIQSAAQTVGARLVIGTNLYAYGKPSGPLSEDSVMNPCSSKGEVRAILEAEALDAHGRGDMEVAIVRGSDFYGPQVTNSVLGDRFFPALLRGKSATLIGRLDVAHSYTFLADFAATMVAVGTGDTTWGQTWIVPSAPAVSGHQLETTVRAVFSEARKSGDSDPIDVALPTPALRSMGLGMLRLGALFVPAARPVIEMYYEFDRPFTVDSSRSEGALGIEPTPLDDGVTQTAQWFMSRQAIAEP